MRMSVFVKQPMDALPFSTCFWTIKRTWFPLRGVQSDEGSSNSEQEFPKIAQPTTVRSYKTG